MTKRFYEVKAWHYQHRTELEMLEVEAAEKPENSTEEKVQEHQYQKPTVRIERKYFEAIAEAADCYRVTMEDAQRRNRWAYKISPTKIDQ